MAPLALTQRSLVALLRELLYGAPAGSAAYVLNPGDAGLLAALDKLSAEAASAPHGGSASIAAHVDHLWYGFTLLNRWSSGENPFAEADYAASWARSRVSAEEWQALRAKLADEVRRWIEVNERPREDWTDETLTGTISSAVHLAYHVGAMRQLEPALKGPRATGQAPTDR